MWKECVARLAVAGRASDEDDEAGFVLGDGHVQNRIQRRWGHVVMARRMMDWKECVARLGRRRSTRMSRLFLIPLQAPGTLQKAQRWIPTGKYEGFETTLLVATPSYAMRIG